MKQGITMKWKQGLFGVVLAVLIVYYFLILGVFTFQQQEEAQLFVPSWWNISILLGEPGGFCSVIGQSIIQYYRNPMWAIAIQTGLLMWIAFGIFHLFERIVSRSYHLFLTCIPILYLLKESVQFTYVVDGTVGLALLLAFLLPLTCITRRKTIALYGVFATCFLFVLAGELAVCFALLYLLFTFVYFFSDKCGRWQGLWSLLPAIFFYLFYAEMGIPIPLSEGLRPVSFLETQTLPLYYIYHVWIYFVGHLVVTLVAVCLLSRLYGGAKWKRIALSLLCFGAVLVEGSSCMPTRRDIQNYLLNQLSYFAREKRWDAIVRLYTNKRITEYVSLNYLNYALSQKGELAERMFAFDQRGSKSLVMPWTQTFFDTKLLCDIHFHIGDLSQAEAYAFDALPLAQRKGSARLLQRLVQINLLKGEYDVAQKYITILSEMPVYAAWARKQLCYIEHPELMQDDEELKGKQRAYLSTDQLLQQMPADSVWASYTPQQRTGWEYRGCSLLADKKLVKFKAFIEETCQDQAVDLPRSFQEGWLLVTEKDSTAQRNQLAIRPEIAANYQRFKESVKDHSAESLDMNAMYRTFGDTYWFYYYFKLFKNREGNK